MATHSSVLALRIPGTAEPGGLPSLGSHSQTRLKRHSSSRRQNKLKNLKTTLCSCKWLTTWHPHMTVLSKFLSDWKMLFMSWDKEYIDIQNVKLEAYPRYQDMINIRHQNEL